MAGIVLSQVGKFWTNQYKKELVQELEELVKKMEKADTSELTELIPKAIYLLIKLYDWSLGGEQDDYQILSDLISEVVQKYMDINKDEIENFIEELEVKLK